jgi:hypothetical protein
MGGCVLLVTVTREQIRSIQGPRPVGTPTVLAAGIISLLVRTDKGRLYWRGDYDGLAKLGLLQCDP